MGCRSANGELLGSDRAGPGKPQRVTALLLDVLGRRGGVSVGIRRTVTGGACTMGGNTAAVIGRRPIPCWSARPLPRSTIGCRAQQGMLGILPRCSAAAAAEEAGYRSTTNRTQPTGPHFPGSVVGGCSAADHQPTAQSSRNQVTKQRALRSTEYSVTSDTVNTL